MIIQLYLSHEVNLCNIFFLFFYLAACSTRFGFPKFRANFWWRTLHWAYVFGRWICRVGYCTRSHSSGIWTSYERHHSASKFKGCVIHHKILALNKILENSISKVFNQFSLHLNFFFQILYFFLWKMKIKNAFVEIILKNSPE